MSIAVALVLIHLRNLDTNLLIPLYYLRRTEQRTPLCKHRIITAAIYNSFILIVYNSYFISHEFRKLMGIFVTHLIK